MSHLALKGHDGMANEVRKIAEVEENVWTRASGKIMAGIAVVILAVALIYASKYCFVGTALQTARIILGLVALGGLGLIGAAVYTGYEVKKMPGVGFNCPYCEATNRFDGEPNESFDCEFCNRTVHFEAGEPVPVRTVNCPFCHTDHRVAVNVQRYVCDRCNRPLELSTQAPGGATAAAGAGADAALHEFDVLLISVDRRHEIEIALKLQNLMVVNLPEARRLMASASTTTPLVVGHGLTQRKAEAIRRQLQDVGATATLRQTNESAAGPLRQG
jgi:ribosomal protein L7/L12